MVIETPTLAITVTPRLKGSPSPKPLYNLPPVVDDEQIHKLIAQVLVAYPKLELTQSEKPPIPRAATKDVALPPKVQAAVAQPANAAVPLRANETGQGNGPRSRRMLYGSVVLLGVVALGVVVWRARRTKSAS